MVILKKAKGDTSGVKGGLKSVFHAAREETLEALKVTGKEIVKGVTMLPRDLLLGGLGVESKSWEDEWLKNKDEKNPPISDKEGGHSKIDPSGMMKKSTEQQLAETRARIASSLNNTFTHSSATSEHGQEQAREYQKNHKPIYDQIQEEKQQKDQQQRQAAAQQSGPIGTPQGKTGRGSALVGKKKKAPNPMELNRTEYKGDKGKQ